MNHNALEIYKQAITFAYGTVEKEHWNTSVFQGVIAGKFAELIVRECVEVIKWTPSQFPNDEYVKNITEHFGVEK